MLFVFLVELFGVGAADTGIGSFQHQRVAGLLERLGLLAPETQFIPFWSLKTLYDLRAEEREVAPQEAPKQKRGRRPRLVVAGGGAREMHVQEKCADAQYCLRGRGDQ